MQEIDLLPEWYKKSKRRKVGYRRQYALLCLFVSALGGVNFLLENSVSEASAELSRLEPGVEEAKEALRAYSEVEREISQVEQRAKILDEIDCGVDGSCILSELSHLVGENIVLKRLDFHTVQPKVSGEGQVKTGAGGALRLSKNESRRRDFSLFGDVRYRVSIRGIAVSGGDVADLICALENSEYFWRVIPSYSRNRELKQDDGAKGKGYEITEFEISCYLANYEGAEESEEN